MSVVIDANALVALAVKEPAAPVVAELLEEWTTEGQSIHAPLLARYELASSLTKQVAASRLAMPDVERAGRLLDALPVHYHQPADVHEVVQLAVALRRRSAYDAAYLALAIDLDAELWTLDGPLARNAAAHDYPVRLIESH